MPSGSSFEVYVRVVADHLDQNPLRVREILGLVDIENSLLEVPTDENREITTIRFKIQRNLATPEDIKTWQTPEFKQAAEWLGHVMSQQADDLRRLGQRLDLCVSDYWGYIPAQLTAEIARLGMHLWVFPHEHP